MKRIPPRGGSSIMSQEQMEKVKVKVEVDKEELDDTIGELKELADNRPNITIRNNQNVYVTINNFNETEKEYSETIEETE